MKSSAKIKLLPALMAVMGICAMALRFWLYAATDAKGLLQPGHPAALILLLLSAVASLLAAAAAYTAGGSGRYSRNFPRSFPGASGCLIFAVGILVTVVMTREDTARMALVRNILGLLCVPALTAMGICRQRGKRPYFFFPAVVCLYVTVFTISHYQLWSSNPQLQDCIFSMAACLLLMVFAYCHTAFTVGMGSRKKLLFSGLAAVFCCFAAIAKNPDWLFFLTGGLWALSNLCALQLPREAPSPESEPQKE